MEDIIYEFRNIVEESRTEDRQDYYIRLRNALDLIQELEEENKELKTIKGFEEENIEVSKFGEWVGKDYIDYKFEYENYQRILADSIPISVIQNKIDEITKYRDLAKELIEERVVIADSDSLNYGRAEAHDKDIQVLQELLEERSDNK